MSEKCPINGHRHYGAARRISASSSHYWCINSKFSYQNLQLLVRR